MPDSLWASDCLRGPGAGRQARIDHPKAGEENRDLMKSADAEGDAPEAEQRL